MPRTPGAERSNRDDATTNPTSSNDATEGWDVGSRWINTVNGSVWFCVDTSIGAAVWKNVSASASGSHPVTIDVVDPTVTDDVNSGYSIGDHWINTANQTIWQAVSVSVGAAIWERVDQPKRNITTSNPTVSNDNTEGYEISSLWINTSTGRVFRATDVSTGAAVWSTSIPRGGMEARNNLSAVVDPAVTDDSNSEYSIGSVWVNTAVSPPRVFVNTDASVGAALWIQTSNNPDNLDTPGLFFLGSILDYSIEGGQTAGEIQYARSFLLAGLTISAIQVFIGSGGTVSRELRVGLYNQTDPEDIFGIPVTRVAQSLSTTTETANGTFFEVPFTSPYLVTVSGYYWIAVISDSASLKFVVTPTVYRENYPPVRREVSTGTTLPATAGVLTNPASAITFAAAVE